ncbi:hypothetical protein [Nocardia sp. NPDC052566]|uniref:hypothetical protein n=1 Tax=Nocardia sp. NPDC052566 TaxID=3364330 RepID=UPI0037C85027
MGSLEHLMGAPARAVGSLTRTARFTAVMYKPHYLLYAVLWVLAVEGTAAVVSHAQPWRPSAATAVRIGVIAFVLLYLRMVDEQKDLGYDRVHHPDRPLVTGAVRATDLRVAMGVIAFGVIAASLVLSVGSAVMITAALAYGVGLWGVETLSAAVRTGILLNLAVTYPVQLILTAYLLISAMDTGEVRPRWQAAAVAIVFAGAFLHFEFARKTSRVRRTGALLYSNALGTAGSVAVVLLAAAVAVLCAIALVPPRRSVIAWIPVALLVIPLWGALTFRRSARDDYPVVPAVLFVFTLYITLITQALS